MEYIGSVSGVSGFRATMDEAGSPYAGPLQDVIVAIVDTFQFASFPILGPVPAGAGFQNFSTLVFQNGRIALQEGGPIAAVHGLTSSPDGVLVNCRNTNIADAALDLLVEVLDGRFGARYGRVAGKRLRLSSLSVRFDKGLSDNIRALAMMSDIVSRAIDRSTRDSRFIERPFLIKKLSFGEEPGEVQAQNPFEQIERSDFTIDARVQHDLKENTFFCSAPLSTEAHLETLAKIEAAALAGT